MAEQLWSGFWVLALINGFWILFSTQLGNADCLTRIVADVLWSGWPRVHSMSASRVYARLLLGFTAMGIVVLSLGDNALSLFKILGAFAGPILAVGAFQILRVNTRFLPKEIQPPMWRRVALIGCGVFYGCITLGADRETGHGEVTTSMRDFLGVSAGVWQLLERSFAWCGRHSTPILSSDDAFSSGVCRRVQRFDRR